MRVFLSIVVGVPLYFLTGYALARLRLPRMWQIAREMYTTDKPSTTKTYQNRSVRQQFGTVMWIWPIYMPFSYSRQLSTAMAQQASVRRIASSPFRAAGAFFGHLNNVIEQGAHHDDTEAAPSRQTDGVRIRLDR